MPGFTEIVPMRLDSNNHAWLADLAAKHEAQRLIAPAPNRLGAYTIEMDLLGNLKRIYYFAKRMARAVAKNVDS